MNILTFLIHGFLTSFFLLAALRIGKSALIAVMALFAVLANLFVMKQMGFFFLTITCSDIYAIGTMLGLSLMQEFYGKEEAKKALYISFFAMGIFLMATQIHLHYQPSLYDNTQGAFQLILGSTPRIIIASFIAFYLSQHVDIFVFSYLRKKWGGKAFIFRLGGTSFVSQLVDTVIFSTLGLWKIVHSLGDVMVVGFLMKCLILLITAPFLSFAHRAYNPEVVHE